MSRKAIISMNCVCVGIFLVSCSSSGSQSTPSATPDMSNIAGKLVFLSQSSYTEGGASLSLYQMDLSSGGTIEELSEQDIESLSTANADSWVERSGNQIVIHTNEDQSTDGTIVVDHETGQPLFTVGDDCELPLSPNGELRPALAVNGLYVTGTDGKARLVFQRRAISIKTPPLVSTEVVKGSGIGLVIIGLDYSHSQANAEATGISCPVWIDDNRLVFDNHQGPFISSGSELDLKSADPQTLAMGLSTPDTTSIVDISKDNAVTHYPLREWRILATSTDPELVAVDFGNNSAIYVAELGQLLTTGPQQAQLVTPCSDPATQQMYCVDFSFSPSRTKLAFFAYPANGSTLNSQLYIWDFLNGQVIQRFDTHHTGAIFWSPDESAVVYEDPINQYDGVVYIGRVDDGILIDLLVEPREYQIDTTYFQLREWIDP